MRVLVVFDYEDVDQTTVYRADTDEELVRAARKALKEFSGPVGALYAPPEPKKPPILELTDDDIGLLPDVRRQILEQERAKAEREYRDSFYRYSERMKVYNDIVAVFEDKSTSNSAVDVLKTVMYDMYGSHEVMVREVEEV